MSSISCRILWLVIRGNTTNLYAMKNAVGAILYHCTDFSNEHFRHRLCPPGESSWCKWKVDQIKGTKTYKPHISIPKWIFDVIQPIFIDLSADTLLSKCLHGQTQNTNEALNHIIWSKVPKAVFVGRSVLEMGVYSAVIEYNDGAAGLRKVLELLGVKSGYFFEIIFL